MSSINEKVKMLETLLDSTCPDPYEAMLVLDHTKNRYLIYTTQKQWERKGGKPNASTTPDSGDVGGRVRTVQNDEAPQHEVPGSGPHKTGGRLKRRTRKSDEGNRPDEKPEPKPEVAKGLPPGQRSYKIPRPGDPDYVAPAPPDRKPKPPRPGEEIPSAFDSEPPPDPSDPSVIVRGKGKQIGCSSCNTKVYAVGQDIPQTMSLLDALRCFLPTHENATVLETVEDAEILENGAMVVDCPVCGQKSSVTLIPPQAG